MKILNTLLFRNIPKKEISCHNCLCGVNKFTLLTNRISSDYQRDILIINQADKEFLELKPTKRNMVLWRGIPVPNPQNYLYNEIIKCLFEKANSLKIFDKIIMPEYAYAGYEIEDAEIYSDINGIIYKINVPKGSKVSRNRFDVIFPRNSEFICKKAGEYKGRKIFDLDYILPNTI